MFIKKSLNQPGQMLHRLDRRTVTLGPRLRLDFFYENIENEPRCASTFLNDCTRLPSRVHLNTNHSPRPAAASKLSSCLVNL
jgi:hypothetical protein